MSFTSSSPSLTVVVPRAFITVFRIFTKDEWYEIKLEMYALKMSPIIIDSYVISWLFFGGYVLNPLLVGAMVSQVTLVHRLGVSMSCIDEYGWSLRSACMHESSPRPRYHRRTRRDAEILFPFYFVIRVTMPSDTMRKSTELILGGHVWWNSKRTDGRHWKDHLQDSFVSERDRSAEQKLVHIDVFFTDGSNEFDSNKTESSRARWGQIEWMASFHVWWTTFSWWATSAVHTSFHSLRLLSLSHLVQDRMETQWPLYTAFYYLQLLEIYFENIAERQLLFDFFSISLMALHDKETNSIDPPILSSSDDDDWDLRFSIVRR